MMALCRKGLELTQKALAQDALDPLVVAKRS